MEIPKPRAAKLNRHLIEEHFKDTQEPASKFTISYGQVKFCIRHFYLNYHFMHDMRYRNQYGVVKGRVKLIFNCGGYVGLALGLDGKHSLTENITMIMNERGDICTVYSS